jgi:hypothetical protein
MDTFDGIRLKRTRAWDQINSLKADIASFLQCDPAPYVPNVDFNGKTQILTISVHINKIPDTMWGIRVGEIVHNLRSALDHVIWELFVKNNRQPPGLRDKHQFPIFDKQAGFNSAIPQFLKGLDNKSVDLLRSEQPFPISEGGTGESIKSPLWNLKELSNCDKHRTIHLVGILLEAYNFTFPPLIHDVTIQKDIVQNSGPIQQDAILARARFPGVSEWPFEERNVKGHLRTNIAFDQWTPAVGGWLVAETLVETANRTDRILRRIAKEIFRFDL